jgi:predicted CXXCH cytochrome family protein
VQCHDPHGSDIMKARGGLAMARLNENCAQCHREQARPFVFEHEALREGCTVCHTPHGSINSKLLVQRDANLCLKCHAQTQSLSGRMFIGKQDHSVLVFADVSQGACWSAGCHPAIHGSNTSRKMHY